METINATPIPDEEARSILEHDLAVLKGNDRLKRAIDEAIAALDRAIPKP